GGSLVRRAAQTSPWAPGGGSTESAERRRSRSVDVEPPPSSIHLLGTLIARLLPRGTDPAPACARASVGTAHARCVVESIPCLQGFRASPRWRHRPSRRSRRA